MLTLACRLPGVGNFLVSVSSKSRVNAIKEAIVPQLVETYKPVELDLFPTGITGTPNGWLHLDDTSRQFEMEKELVTRSDTINPAYVTKDLFRKAPSKDVIHLLVKISSAKWSKVDGQFPPLVLAKNPIVRIPDAYIRHSGLFHKKRDLVLYRRPELLQEWQSLHKCIGISYAELWIVGPPGTGKSCAAFAFACALDRTDWDIVWINFRKRLGNSNLRCILFRGQDKWICEIGCEIKALRHLFDLLQGRTLVFVDGYTFEKDPGYAIQRVCLSWHYKKEADHRLVWVSSMVTRGKDSHPYENELIPTQVEARITSNATFDKPTPSALSEEELFMLMSWSLKDYEHAMENDEFFEYVKPIFTDTEEVVSIEDRMQLLKDKFFVAGGSARYMFDGPVEKAMDDVNNAIEVTDGIERYVLKNRGISPSGVENRLYAWRRVGDSDATTTSLLSRFVGRQLAQKLGPEFVRNISCSLAAFDRRTCMFELWFFAKFMHGGIEYHERAEDEYVSPNKWWASKVQYFDPNGLIPINTSVQWLAPSQWSQGGYDAVHVELKSDETGVKVRVQFIQVTCEETRTFKAQYFSSFLVRLAMALPGTGFESLEVYFAVPCQILPTFKLQTTTKEVQDDVLEPAGMSKSTTIASVQVVGLPYEKFQESKKLDKKRVRVC